MMIAEEGGGPGLTDSIKIYRYVARDERAVRARVFLLTRLRRSGALLRNVHFLFPRRKRGGIIRGPPQTCTLLPSRAAQKYCF